MNSPHRQGSAATRAGRRSGATRPGSFSLLPLAATTALIAIGAMGSAGSARAQASGTAPAPAEGSATKPPAAEARKPASAPPQRVDVTGGRPSDLDERRQSTASKIVIGREEIERFGDTSTTELLKRLPGITVPGAPGRGGPPRMRGLGAGYTQILIDGERMPPGFSLENLSPEQLERVEILRAPTAETGARAIGGTINIVLREGYRRRLNDLRLGLATERGRLQGNASWTRNESTGPYILTGTVSMFRRDALTLSRSLTETQDLSDGELLLRQEERGEARETRTGLNANGRIQWRGEKGNGWTLMPMFIAASGGNARDGVLTQSVGAVPAPYTISANDGDGSFRSARIGGQGQFLLPTGTRLDLRGNVASTRWASSGMRKEFDAAGLRSRLQTDDTRISDRSVSTTAKATHLMDNGHSLVGGVELEANRRSEARTTLQNGLPLLADFGENLTASSQRTALYAQDEWSINPQWSAYAGLRWEGIVTEGEPLPGMPVRNRSSVWTPLLHTAWKFDPKGRDQIRVSLTRSYKSPTLQNLIARPSLNSRYPAPGGNLPTQADRAGNPNLQPELATGVDIAVERYLPGGVLSANVFRRQIKDYMRSVTALEAVPWANEPRWVSRMQNVGDAVTQGVELEAKFKLNQLLTTAPAVDLRSNLSLFSSRVEAVPGPNNRLDEQPKGTLNLGADYRINPWKTTVGGNLTYTPSYTTRISEAQTRSPGLRRVFDAYASINLDANTLLRVSVGNAFPLDQITAGALDVDSLRSSDRVFELTATTWRVGLEFKL